MSEPIMTPGRIGLEAIGDFVDRTISRGVERNFEAPVLQGDPEINVWYRIFLPDCMAGDGSEYHIYIKRGNVRRLVIFLSGGGVAWNAYTAARPVTGGAMAAGLPNFYWNNLRGMTQIMNINNGITELDNPSNPCNDWDFLVIPYATGDLHVGNHDFAYKGEDGTDQILHFHGYRNFLSAMKKGKEYFENPEQILIAGDSAGAFAVPAVTPDILENFYPECENVTLLSDSGQLLYKDWRKTARDVWQAPKEIWSAIHSYNLTVEWYKRVWKIWGDRLRYLYAGSPRDYLLSAYYNDVVSHKYKSNPAVQNRYYHQMQEMLTNLKKINPHFGFFIYRFASLRMPVGGTVHTAVRHKRFYFQTGSGLSMAAWLGDALNGNVYDANVETMLKGKM